MLEDNTCGAQCLQFVNSILRKHKIKKTTFSDLKCLFITIEDCYVILAVMLTKSLVNCI